MAQENISVLSTLESYVNSFDDIRDKEVVIILFAWLSCDGLADIYTLVYVVKLMKNAPYAFIIRDESIKTPVSLGAMSHHNLTSLLFALRSIYTRYDTVYDAYWKIIKNPRRNKIHFEHEAICKLMATQHSGFQSCASGCTFYRHNLMLFLFVNVFGTWRDSEKLLRLVPCTDIAFTKAREMGVIEKDMKPSLANAIKLTKRMKAIYDNDYIKITHILYGW